MSRAALFAQAIRGPILLIAVGVLFALHQAGTLSFWRSWPLLIIVIGVIKLAERLAMPAYVPPQTPYQQYPPPGGPRV
jgi:hypothetical protein